MGMQFACSIEEIFINNFSKIYVRIKRYNNVLVTGASTNFKYLVVLVVIYPIYIYTSEMY